jgi:hypothetical protein
MFIFSIQDLGSDPFSHYRSHCAITSARISLMLLVSVELYSLSETYSPGMRLLSYISITQSVSDVNFFRKNFKTDSEKYG